MQKASRFFLTVAAGLILTMGLADLVWAAERAIRLTVPECST